MRGFLRQALRALCLPYRAPLESTAARALGTFLRSNGVTYVESADWIALQLGNWLDSHIPPQALIDAVDVVLIATSESNQLLSGIGYFVLYDQLRNTYEYSHPAAVALLSHLRTAHDLSSRYRLSAGRLAYVLSALDMRFHFSRPSITASLNLCEIPVGLSVKNIQDLWEQDGNEESSFFADSDLSVGAELVANLSVSLGYVGDLAADLRQLASAPNVNTYVPQLQMLHYQCVICEFYDHSVLDFYEFNPRGVAANWLFDRYPGTLASAGNPFLNNAKSVQRADLNWAESKKAAVRPGAMALYRILSSLDAMSYSQRRELASRIRQWIFLFMRLSEDPEVLLPALLELEEIRLIANTICLKNTSTFGILEQRLVDALSCSAHLSADWISRGLADSVNATNVSRRKVGDCDYQNSIGCRIVAYEAHGGRLTQTYIAEHVRTLRRVIPLRKIELEAVSDVENWTLEIIFVAHSVDAEVTQALQIDGLQITMRLMTFREFVLEMIEGDLIPSFVDYFLMPLKERRTPASVRSLLIEILA